MILAFRFGPIPVRIHAWFPVAALILALGAHHGPAGIATRAVGFLITAFAHDLAHAAAARSFGAPAEVNLTLYRGGLGSWIVSLSPVRKVVVSLAGPAVSLVIAVVTMGIVHADPSVGEVGVDALRYLGFVNLGWGLLNLLPLLPLDGGHALVALLDGATKKRGEESVRLLSIACAAVLGLVGALHRAFLPVFVCGVVALHNARALRTQGARNGESIMRVHLQAAFDALERGEAATAIGHCREVLSASTSPATRRDAVRLLAYAYASVDSWGRLMDLLESGGVSALEDGELEKYERTARELGRRKDAERIASLRHGIA
jgi:Zn-dependent protease